MVVSFTGVLVLDIVSVLVPVVLALVPRLPVPGAGPAPGHHRAAAGPEPAGGRGHGAWMTPGEEIRAAVDPKSDRDS